MNYKFLKLLFANLVNLEELLKKLEECNNFFSECDASIHKEQLAALVIRIKEYEDIIKAYVENHK